MHIWIISAGTENLVLMRFLQRFDCTYSVLLDSAYRPYGDKDTDVLLLRYVKLIETLIKKWADYVIVHPIYEMRLLQNIDNPAIGLVKKYILPLFGSYLHTFCLWESLIWKIWCLWTTWDIIHTQNLIQNEIKNYTLSDKQTNTKRFHTQFAFRTKTVPLRNYMLTSLSPREYFANTVIKFDCRYFKDAGVDTIIPLQYSYFLYQKTITNFFNQNKQKFHWLQKVEQCFETVATHIGVHKTTESKKHTDINIYHTGPRHHITDHKKRTMLLEQWWSSQMVFIMIDV